VPQEASMKETESGLVPAGAGWFVVNVRDAAWMTAEGLGWGCTFEQFPPGDASFEQLGINIRVLEPGQPAAMYHAEPGQEAFLVLSGECLAIIDEEERTLKPWDFVHCPPGTPHVFVGGGDMPCVILMVGARGKVGEVSFPFSEAASRHGAGVESETQTRQEAYAKYGAPKPARPASWEQLPWA
jgi:uncharacterized cupin superfamily protein